MGSYSTNDKIGCAQMLLNEIENIEHPMLMYQIEKDIVKEALMLYVISKERTCEQHEGDH